MADRAGTGAAATVTRRGVLVGSGVLAAATATGVLPGLADPAYAQPPQRLTAGTFAAQIGRTFAFTVRGAETVTLRLEAVDRIGTGAATGSGFSARFHGPAARRQGGQVGTLAGPDLRPTRLLVVPSGRPHPAGQDWVVTVVGAEPAR